MPNAFTHLTQRQTDAVERAYWESDATGKPRALLVPTNPILEPVDPVGASKRFALNAHLAVCVAADALDAIYNDPTAATIKRFALELNYIAAEMKRSERERAQCACGAGCTVQDCTEQELGN